MLAAVAMCIQFRSYLRGARFTLRTDHKSLVWLHRFKDTEGMMYRWLHTLKQFQFSIVHQPGKDYGNDEICVLLEVPGTELLPMVHIGAERERPY